MTEVLRTEHAFRVMGGPATLVINHLPSDTAAITSLIHRVIATLSRLEQRYSRYLPDSLISTINQQAGTGRFTPIDEETRALLTVCDVLWAQSGGLFDATAGVLGKAWDFRTGTLRAPEDIEALTQCVGWQYVDINDDGICLQLEGMELDLGGVAKEYAADTAAALLQEAGIDSALVELAGDIVAVGCDRGDKPWRVGIRDPKNTDNSLVSVELVSAALATSGNYARRISINGHSYSHLLDPRTGWPVKGPESVSVVGGNCLTAGAVATVGCLYPPASAQQWLEDAALPWLMVTDGTCMGPLSGQG